jgi:phosphoribosyl-AMP cyclohydrolase
MSEIEESTTLGPDFGKIRGIGQEVLPVVLQERSSREVLFIGFANRHALEETLRTGKAVLWSTTRDELWVKGATSGDELRVHEVRINCEQNSLLYIVSLLGEGACHSKDATGRARTSCYYRRVLSTVTPLEFS